MNIFHIWLLCMLVGSRPPTMNRHIMMSNENQTAKLQPLILWTVHSHPPDDPSLSCYLQNNTWFCTDHHVLYSLSDSDDSY